MICCSWGVIGSPLVRLASGAVGPTEVAGLSFESGTLALTPCAVVASVEEGLHPPQGGLASMIDTACTHLDQIRDVAPRTPEGCEECLAWPPAAAGPPPPLPELRPRRLLRLLAQ